MVYPKMQLRTPNTLEVSYKLDVDFRMIIHSSWVDKFNEIFLTDYMRQMMIFLHEMYKVKYITPSKADLFKPFKLTDFNDLQVVIIADKPYPNLRHCNGLALANPNQVADLRPEIEAVSKCIEREIYNNFYLAFDHSLHTWAEQGVLLLNAAMTHIENYRDANPVDLWRDFMRQIVKVINDKQSGIHFLLLGDDAQYFKRYIDPELHYVYEYELPSKAVRYNREWECPYFKIINRFIADNNGPEYCIEW